jgi:hypothetical protein
MAKTTDTAPKSTTIHRSAFSGGQSKDFTHTQSVGGHKLLVKIHHDTSYQNQSRASVDVWTPAGWTQVVQLHSSEVATTETPYVSGGSKAIPVTAFAAVEKILVTAALAVLTA